MAFGDKRARDLWGFYWGGDTERPKSGLEYPCFECGVPTAGKHHVVPVSFGGTRQLPLCTICHQKVHGTQLFGSEMIKAGLKKARKNGTRLGAPLKITREQIKAIVELREAGNSYHSIAENLGISVGRVHTLYRRETS
jgi:hypothetical protein